MSAYASIGRDILVADKCFKAFFKNAIKRHGLNTAEGMVLLTLYDNDKRSADEIRDATFSECFGCTQDEIIDELSYDKGVMARTMQSLETKGYVIRCLHPTDNRSYLFSQTVKAAEFKPELISILQAWYKILVRDVENLESVKCALQKMAENAKSTLMNK